MTRRLTRAARVRLAARRLSEAGVPVDLYWGRQDAMAFIIDLRQVHDHLRRAGPLQRWVLKDLARTLQISLRPPKQAKAGA